MPQTLRQQITAITVGATTATTALDIALTAATLRPSVFTRLGGDEVRAAAAQIDEGEGRGRALGGALVSVKDLFDVRGEVNLAGSVVLRHEQSAAREDAFVIARLRRAGVLFVGRANMSEFAFSGLGLNPHYGNPLCIWDRATGRLPGGSSSGGAVGVAEGIVPATIGSDTAGSCRLPAAFNGIVGVKPSYGRLSLQGVYPLSPTSDAPGPMANDVDGCFMLDAIMRGADPNETPAPIAQRDPALIRLWLPRAKVTNDIERQVESALTRALDWLRDAGVSIMHAPLTMLDDCLEMFYTRAPAVFEAYLAHQSRLESRGDEYDPFVRRRLLGGAKFNRAAREAAYREKAALIEQCKSQVRISGVDALVYPTAACIPPALTELTDAKKTAAINLNCLRNASTVNYFDGCAISLPCHLPDEPPVGLMLSAMHGEDDSLYQIAAAVEGVLDARRGVDVNARGDG